MPNSAEMAALLVLLFMVAGTAGATEKTKPELPTYICKRTPSPIVIDGRLQETAWQTASAATLVRAESGAPSGQPTVVRLLWDAHYLYVSFRSEDRDIRATMTRRDDPVWQEEVVEIFLSPNQDIHEYFEFNVSPKNVVFDARIHNPSGYQPKDDSGKVWNCRELKTAVHLEGTLDKHDDTDSYWSVEMAIPFSELSTAPNIPPVPGDVWRMNLYRIDLWPVEEYQAWSPPLANPPNFHLPSSFGTLRFEE
jgi:hypothetical protein